MKNPLIYETVRTPRSIGKPTGALYEVKPIDLLGITLKTLQTRTQLKTNLVDEMIVGCVTPVADQGGNIAKAALLNAGWSPTVSGFHVNKFCASGLESVSIAASKIQAGWESIIIAGGVESMSRVPMGMDGGPMMYDTEVASKINFIPQGVGADLVATLMGYSRYDLDAYALLSHQRARMAVKNDYFDRSMVKVKDHNGLLILGHEEYLRKEASLEALASLKPSFMDKGKEGFEQLALLKHPEIEKIQYLHTAGNSCGIVDAAALVLIGEEETGKNLGLRPRAKIKVMKSHSGDPTVTGNAAMVAQKALKAVGMESKDIDLWEVNEPFAAILLKFREEMDIDIDKINVNGGAIALGHPLGATGTILLIALIDELERRGLQNGMVVIPTGVGMALATIIEMI